MSIQSDVLSIKPSSSLDERIDNYMQHLKIKKMVSHATDKLTEIMGFHIKCTYQFHTTLDNTNKRIVILNKYTDDLLDMKNLINEIKNLYVIEFDPPIDELLLNHQRTIALVTQYRDSMISL